MAAINVCLIIHADSERTCMKALLSWQLYTLRQREKTAVRVEAERKLAELTLRLVLGFWLVHLNLILSILMI